MFLKILNFEALPFFLTTPKGVNKFRQLMETVSRAREVQG